MSQLRCTCGYGITDNTDNLPFKAHFLPDEDVGHAMDDLLTRVAAFIEARERGEQEQYLTEQAIFTRGPTLQDVLDDLFLHPTFEFGRDMYECEECGRIWMQARPHKNEWVSYQPESARRDILTHEGATSDE